MTYVRYDGIDRWHQPPGSGDDRFYEFYRECNGLDVTSS